MVICSFKNVRQLWWRLCRRRRSLCLHFWQISSSNFHRYVQARCVCLMSLSTACFTGSRPLSPFGLYGIIARKRLRRTLQKLYPRLLEECSAGGLASFARETAIDMGFVPETPALPDKRLDADAALGDRNEGHTAPTLPPLQLHRGSFRYTEIYACSAPPTGPVVDSPTLVSRNESGPNTVVDPNGVFGELV